MLGGKVLIDGDIIAYRAAFASEKDFVEDAKNKVDELMQAILKNTCVFIDRDSYEVYLSGRTNFRHEIAKTAPYKGNRKSRPKPIHLGLCRDYLTIEYGAITTDGEEADDAMAIRATELGKDTIIASVDKDMLQVPCLHYNITKQTLTEVSEADGKVSFFCQVLTGDTADNIYGIYGIGPKKAAKLLKDCQTDLEYWSTIVKAYEDDGGGEERAIETAQLVWLRRKEGELWQPPDMP
jgi:5'-3' exonuclease